MRPSHASASSSACSERRLQQITAGRSFLAALTGVAGTTLSGDQFVVGAAALDANDRIIYNNGTLTYDRNGNLAGGVQVIAFLSGKPALSNTDILLG